LHQHDYQFGTSRKKKPLNDSNMIATQYELQKEVKSNIKQPSCKSVWPHCEKRRCEIQNGCDGRLMANFDISGEFGVKS